MWDLNIIRVHYKNVVDHILLLIILEQLVFPLFDVFELLADRHLDGVLLVGSHYLLWQNRVHMIPAASPSVLLTLLLVKLLLLLYLVLLIGLHQSDTCVLQLLERILFEVSLVDDVG